MTKMQFNPDSYCDCCSEAGTLEKQLREEIARLSKTLEEWRDECMILRKQVKDLTPKKPLAKTHQCEITAPHPCPHAQAFGDTAFRCRCCAECTQKFCARGLNPQQLKSCKHPPAEPHACEYESDVEENPDFRCVCCQECRKECARSI